MFGHLALLAIANRRCRHPLSRVSSATAYPLFPNQSMNAVRVMLAARKRIDNDHMNFLIEHRDDLFGKVI